MRRRQSPSPHKKPTFDRRFLWLIIFIMIPLIPLLNSLGPAEAFMVSTTTEAAQTEFAAADLRVHKTAVAEVPTTWSSLPGSQLVRISVLTDRQPLARPEPPAMTDLAIEARHGYLLVTLTLPLTTSALEAGTRFLDNWLPLPNDRTRYALSGDLTPELVLEIGDYLRRADAPGAGFDPASAPAVTTLTSPLPGRLDYEAFVIATDLLRRRLGGYNAQLRWDHSERQSKALLNITLAPDQRHLPTPEQFEASLARRVTDLNRSTLTTAQIHRQLITLAAYDLPTDILTQRQSQLETLDYAAFTDHWEAWFGPTQ